MTNLSNRHFGKSQNYNSHVYYLQFIRKRNQSLKLHIEWCEEQIMNWEGYRRKWSRCNLKSCQRICLEELRETRNILVKIFSIYTSVYAAGIITLFRHFLRYGRITCRRAYQLCLFHYGHILLFKHIG